MVLYSHDSVGLGHTRRNLAIAEALAAGMPEATGRPVSGLIISGASDAAQFPLPDGWDWLLVPGITKNSKGTGPGASAPLSSYVPRRLDVAPQRVRGLRSSVITGALLTFRPHLVIVDRHPFGADGELDEPLTEFRAQKPEARIVLGLREVLDDPVTAMREWEHVGVDRVADLYDELWVYGDRSVHDTIATGEIPPQLVHKTHFTGLLAADRPARADVDLPEIPFVVTMVGGGGDGAALARCRRDRTAARRRRTPPRHRPADAGRRSYGGAFGRRRRRIPHPRRHDRAGRVRLHPHGRMPSSRWAVTTP